MLFKYIKLLVMTLALKTADSGVDNIAGPIGSSQNYEVVFVTMVFRHGDRAPDKLYPNDPNKVEDFYPPGLGELTLTGKARAYELGTQIRHLYKDFLGEKYVPYAVKARSTDVNRTKMSLNLVLSALYPSGLEQTLDSMSNQQTIPFEYVPIKDDCLLALFSCPLYIKELERVEKSEASAQLKKIQPLIVNLTEWTGASVHSSYELLSIYNTLMSELSMGLKLPEWSKGIFPNGELMDAAILRLEILNYNIKLCKLSNGCLMKTIIESMNGIADGTIKDGRKIHLFSVHDINVASLLIILGVFEPHLPQYSSAVMVELLRDEHQQYFVGIRYYLGDPSISRVLYIPGYDTNPCPLDKFIRFIENIMPMNDDVSC